MLRILSEKKHHTFYEQHINEVRPVLFEIQNEGGFMYGFTDNYIKVKHPHNRQLVNKVTMTTLTEQENEMMLCSVNSDTPFPQAEFNSYFSASKI